MTTSNPISSTFSGPPPSISSRKIHIAGILTTVYGLDEIPQSSKSISCLWLLHPRLQTKESMGGVAAACLTDWHQRSCSGPKVGLIAVAFDQRNHGGRQVDALANEAWRHGNEKHAQDMFSVFHGTALDISLLIDHLGSYIFNEPGALSIEQHIVLGVSLGGHSAWQCLFSDSRITAAVVIIGCPDYMCVMKDRARLSKLQTYTASNGAEFLGSKDFPNALISSVQKWDPKGILFGTTEIKTDLSVGEQHRFRQILDQKIKGKRILVCSGGDDKLVPYRCSEHFLHFLKTATSGWYKDGGVYLEDNVYPGVGHAYSEKMLKDSIKFVSDTLTAEYGKGTSSKI